MRYFYIAVIFILLFKINQVSAQTKPKHFGEQAYMLVKVMEKYHYQPQTLNDDFSEKLYKSFLKDLDPAGFYFTKNEIEGLNDFRTKLDDDINNQSVIFLEKATSVYKKRLVLADTLIGELLSKPINFSAADTIYFGKKKESVNYTANDAALKKLWNKWLKYQVLTSLFSPVNENDDPFSKDVKVLLEKEPDARKKALISNKRSIKRILESPEGFENYVASVYLNNIAELYDPHSSFFTSSGKQDFESSVSADVLSFGVYFDENDNGEIIVDDLVPGGAAWKSNQINKGDVLLKIQPVNGKITELNNASVYEVYEITESSATKEADFTIRKANGQVKKVRLLKSKLRSDENVVKSYILKGNKKIGYISLPSFYTEWENNNPLGCANDVAKEIVKLQEENIDGLVMDLRYNGGGSVREAIGLAGLFIDEGPLAIYKTRNEKPFLLKDMNRGTAYNGPLVVMVNGASASASEIFAASVKDYNRAVIVGSPTYGKATGQIILPLDTTLNLLQLMNGYSPKKDNDLGYVKITTEKFYHVTKRTHQSKGIQPDVLLPETYYYTDYKEASYPNALPNDSIIKNIVYTPLQPIKRQQIADKSKNRLAGNKNFKRLKEINDSLAQIQNQETSIVLNPQNFKKVEKTSYRLSEEMYAAISDSSEIYSAQNNYYDQKLISIDSYTKDINDVLIKNIQNDIYIEEAYNIISDLINFDKN